MQNVEKKGIRTERSRAEARGEGGARAEGGEARSGLDEAASVLGALGGTERN